MSGSCAATNGLASRHRARGKTPARLQDQSIEGLALPIVTPIAKHRGISRNWRSLGGPNHFFGRRFANSLNSLNFLASEYVERFVERFRCDSKISSHVADTAFARIGMMRALHRHRPNQFHDWNLERATYVFLARWSRGTRPCGGNGCKNIAPTSWVRTGTLSRASTFCAETKSTPKSALRLRSMAMISSFGMAIV